MKNVEIESKNLRNIYHKQLIVKPGKPLIGEISSDNFMNLPGDKSISHRTALFASMAVGTSVIENFQVSGVTRPLLDILKMTGIQYDLQGELLIIEGTGIGHLKKPAHPLHCGNSATAMRLVAGAMAAGGVECQLDGTPGLRRRPMSRIIDPLKKMGVKISSTNGCAPLVLRKSNFPLLALQHELQIASAQVKSCILIAALSAEGTTIIIEPGPSRDHTERLLSKMGALLTREVGLCQYGYVHKTSITSNGFPMLKPIHMRLPGDFSSAAFLIVAACITPGSRIILRDIGLNPTRTGLIDALKEMGASIDIEKTGESGGEPIGDLTVQHSQLTGVCVSGELVVRMIDEFPAFAIAAAFANGETIVSDAKELRYKETDRIRNLCQELLKLEVNIQEKSEGFIIRGRKKVKGNLVTHHGDHRLAMSLAIAGLVTCEPIYIPEPEIIEESFPNFAKVFQSLGADLEYV